MHDLTRSGRYQKQRERRIFHPFRSSCSTGVYRTLYMIAEVLWVLFWDRLLWILARHLSMCIPFFGLARLRDSSSATFFRACGIRDEGCFLEYTTVILKNSSCSQAVSATRKTADTDVDLVDPHFGHVNWRMVVKSLSRQRDPFCGHLYIWQPVISSWAEFEASRPWNAKRRRQYRSCHRAKIFVERTMELFIYQGYFFDMNKIISKTNKYKLSYCEAVFFIYLASP